MKHRQAYTSRTSFLFFTLLVNSVAVAATPATTVLPIKLLSETALQVSQPFYIDKTVKRHRLANVNFNLLGGQGNLAVSADQVQAIPKDITLNLFSGVNLIATRNKLSSMANGAYGWQGKIKGDAFSQVTLVVHDGRTTGDIRTRNGIYQIRPLPGGKHAIYQINEQAFPESKSDAIVTFEDATGAPDIAQANSLATSADDGTTIDVMVAYTPQAATNAGGAQAIQDLINATVLSANTVYQNSGINQRLRLVKTYQTTVNSSGNFSTDLDRLRITNDGFMDEIHAMRDSSGADLVSLWIEGTSSCGIGYLWSTASTAFTVVAQNCASSNLSFAHETGHNMGARHDWYVDATIDNPTYNHGYINTAARWRTVMSYNDLCVAKGFNCTRISYLSNPNVTYSGAATGAATGFTTCTMGNASNPVCDANNSRIHNDRAYTVANFRQAVNATISIPQAPSNLVSGSVSTSQINLSWTDNANNETSFKVERCQGATCTNFLQIGTSAGNVSNYTDNGLAAGTTYRYRVRASNSVGDSSYSNIVNASTSTVVVTPPSAPSNLVGTPSGTQVNLTWTDNANNETGFKIERCLGTATCNSFVEIATVGSNVTSFSNTGLSAGTTYSFRVRANNSAGNSAYSNISTVTTSSATLLLSAPSNLSAKVISRSVITLTWRDNSNNESGFRVQYCRGIFCSSFTTLGATTANIKSANITGLAANTYYSFRVQAFNASIDSAFSNTAMGLTLP